MGPPLAAWARLLGILYPRRFRDDLGRDLEKLLLDGARDARARGRGALAWFVVANTAIGARDAALERSAALVDTWRQGRREAMSTSWLYSFKLVVRGLLRRPGHAIAVVVTLALGIGASTATFTVLNSVVLRPLPYPEAERLVEVRPVNTARGNATWPFSLPDVRDWEERSASLAALGAYTMLNSDLVYTGGPEAIEIETTYVTTGFYEALAVSPRLGRLPTEEEELGDNRVVVVSHAFWEQYLGSDPAAVGRTLPLSGEGYRVVGVMPPDFDFPTPRVGLWAFLTVIPAESTPYHIRQVRLLDAVGRMADGASLESVREELGSIASALARELPDSNEELTAASVRPLHERVVGDVDRALAIVMAAALLILLITSANLANLALARESRRAPEQAVRAALGASAARRAGLVLAEGLLLSMVGGAVGLLLAAWGTRVLVAYSGGTLPRAHEIAPDWRVATFTLVVSVATGAAFTLLASLRAGRTEVADRMRASARGAAAGGMRGTLVVSQIALSVVLLVGAALLVESLRSLARVDVGFEPEGLVVADMTFASSRFSTSDEYLARFEATQEALEAIPGVRSVSTIRRFPFRGVGESVRWTLPGAPEDDEGITANLLQAGEGLFETMGIGFVDGSDFPSDGSDGRLVVVASRSLAAAAFGGERAVGRTLVLGPYELEIVGVVEDIRQRALRGEPDPVVYIPNRLNPRRAASFVIRMEPGVAPSLDAVRAAIRDADSQQPITELALARDIVAEQLTQPRFFTLLLIVFAGLAVALCSVGVYGVVAFGVSSRRREVGIRLALGAEPGGVRALVVRQGMRSVVAGIVVGLALTLFAVRALDALLHGVARFEPSIYVVVSAALAVVGLTACWLPARRAAGGRAIEALTAE